MYNALHEHKLNRAAPNSPNLRGHEGFGERLAVGPLPPGTAHGIRQTFPKMHIP